MSKENQSYLRFTLEESIWFQKGQEVAELFSLSLDPNVTIQENEQYAVIRGTLDLVGEYKNVEQSDQPELEELTQAYYSKEIQSVETREDGMNEFIHHFPVDITIPTNRIHSLDDIEVEIQTFDYFLPEQNCLKLEAELFITGIYGESREMEDEEEQEEQESVEYLAVETVSQTMQKLPEQRENEAERVVAEKPTPSPELTESDKTDNLEEMEVVLQTAYMDEMEREQQKAYIQEQAREDMDKELEAELQPLYRGNVENVEEEVEIEVDLFTPFTAEAKKLPNIEEAEKSRVIYPNKIPAAQAVDPDPQTLSKLEESRPPIKVEPKIQPKEEVRLNHKWVDNEEEKVASNQTDIKANQEPEVKQGALLELARRKESNPSQSGESRYSKAKMKGKDKEAAIEPSKEHISLMDYLGRKQEEELTNLKVCIVQQGDTIDTLAERYSISSQSILNSNELEHNQDVYEGQVIYIPKVVSSSKK